MKREEKGRIRVTRRRKGEKRGKKGERKGRSGEKREEDKDESPKSEREEQ